MMMKAVTALRAIALLGSALLLLGCASQANRPYVQASALSEFGCRSSMTSTPEKRTTPEVSRNPDYTLHFLEFDDQGWAYPNPSSTDGRQHSARQIDCAIADLRSKLERGRNVRSFVFVHGWHHSAADDDRDLNRFRAMLTEQARNENREVIGFYIGWNGNSLDIPILKDTTFWGRKNAAHHVSEGSIREFFARMKTLRDYWNKADAPGGAGCVSTTTGFGTKVCPLRTVMIGHSFGAWILFASTSPYILETLAGNFDLPANAASALTPRERGIADLIVLLNPAFEATRYDAVHRAAERYKTSAYEPPLLVSITSTADLATGNIFPVARFFNSIFQYPATTEDESVAMKRTHGHLPGYLTHELTIDPLRASSDNLPDRCIDKQGRPSTATALRHRFFPQAAAAGPTPVPTVWSRDMCGGLELKTLPTSTLDRNSIVWNIRTSREIIPDHNSITTRPLTEFIQQLYGDIGAVAISAKR